MGDRANIVVISGNERVTLYTHWDGYILPELLKRALIRGTSRWRDFQYLTRIIFCELIQNDVLGVTGYGISQYVADGGDKVITVNLDLQAIHINEQAYSFDEYMQEENPNWQMQKKNEST